jgi:probable F420-dependent oxidoreductase
MEHPTVTTAGVWSGELRYHPDRGEAAAAAAELEELGYGALWIPDVGGDLFGALDDLLGATARLTVASGILNVWFHEPADTGRWWDALDDARRSRTLLGVGISHGPLIGEAWGKPIDVMAAYLDGLDAAGVPAGHRCIGALGPRMLELARTRTAGAHPYLVTSDHTARIRETVGPDALVAVELGVVLEPDASRSRDIARAALEGYADLPNYRNSWFRIGFTSEDADGRSDRLLDALFARGSVEDIAARVAEHRDAGADHVCIQVLREPGAPGLPLDGWRELAPALVG